MHGPAVFAVYNAALLAQFALFEHNAIMAIHLVAGDLTGIAVQQGARFALHFLAGEPGDLFEPSIDRNNGTVGSNDHDTVLDRVHYGFPILIQILLVHLFNLSNKFTIKLFTNLTLEHPLWQHDFAKSSLFRARSDASTHNMRI
jgi:hypothetical protein